MQAGGPLGTTVTADQRADRAAADYTVGLPAVTSNAGKLIGFRMAPGLTKFVTLDGNASELIDGTATRVMWANEVAILLCDGTAWTKIGGKSIPMNCGMYPTAATTVALSPTVTLVPLAAVITDNTGGMASASNNRVLMKRPGTYRVSANCYYQPGSGNSTELRCTVDKSGVSNGVGFSIEWGIIPAAQAIRIEFFTDAQVVAGDYLQMSAMVNTTTRALYVNDQYWTFLKVSEIVQW